MVAFTEGLRAPAIGVSLAGKAVAQTSGRAAAALALTGMIAASGGVALGNAGATIQNGYTPVNLPTRSAPLVSASSNPLLSAASATKAPSLGGRALDGVGNSLASGARALPTASGGLGTAIEDAARSLPKIAASGEGLLPKVLNGAGKFSPLGFLPEIADFLKGDNLADEAGQLAKRKSQEATDKQTARNKAQRKGENNPNRRQPPSQLVGVPAGTYRVTTDATAANGTHQTITQQVQGPIGGITKIMNAFGYEYWGYNHGPDQSFVVAANTTDFPSAPTISITRIDGGSDPAPIAPPTQEDANPAFHQGGLAAAPTNSNNPVLPNAETKPANPAQTNPLPPVRPSVPSSPSSPSSPSVPSVPSLPSLPSVPSLPSAPSSLTPSVPSIPSAPSTGSATATMPIFEPSFTTVPSERNTNALKPIEPPEPEPQKKPGCADPCMDGLQNDADKNKPVSISVKVFKICSAKAKKTAENLGDDGKAVFEMKQITVPKAEADNYSLLYERIAKLEALQCETPGSAIAAVPEWWQLRPEAQRPQLVVLYAEVLGTGKLTDSRWTLSLPHYNRPKGYKPKLPSYQKGNFEGILVLTDNSKIIVNASSETECKRVLNSLKLNIPAKYRISNGKAVKVKVGERVNNDFKKCRVIPIRADFFSTGMRNLQPDWSINFRQ